MNTPFIVAELSCNHMGVLKYAHDLIDAAADAGCDAIKLQTFDPETMVLDHEFVIPEGPWAGRLLIDLYREAHTPWKWHFELFNHAKRVGLVAFSTAFDKESVDFLETLECPIYKISSFEMNDLALIRYIATKNKPIIISTGMATLQEVNEARMAAKPNLMAMLHCVSAYPAPIAEANIRSVAHMRMHLGVDVGLSDHTLGSGAACAAVALGATVIEKHLCLSDALNTLDSKFSVNPIGMGVFVRDVRDAYASLGTTHYGPTYAEMSSYNLRRSLYFARDVSAGARIMADDIRTARPAMGARPTHLPDYLGRILVNGAKAGSPVPLL